MKDPIFYKNKGVERNKTPLQNIVYYVEILQLKGGKKKVKIKRNTKNINTKMDIFIYLGFIKKEGIKYIKDLTTPGKIKRNNRC